MKIQDIRPYTHFRVETVKEEGWKEMVGAIIVSALFVGLLIGIYLTN